MRSPALNLPPDARVARRVSRPRGRRRKVGMKRAFERPAPSDGVRVLVDRLWPRGQRKEQLAIDLWLKDLAPSDALRRWYGHEPDRWASFAEKYRAELSQHADVVRVLDELRRRGRVTLLYGARDRARNNAIVLRDVLEELRLGPGHVSSSAIRKGD